ncbi:hypothetical protein CDAR_200231 [Caerostris darwini]|uniref:Uncharacterized protein n=1 Tax=Caerostris darwini TaxID=1538125 RepID=A0AAV4RHU2_9ARAC|nr:hypothetical protein CDAR_200231 [Caerostris darwini]
MAPSYSRCILRKTGRTFYERPCIAICGNKVRATTAEKVFMDEERLTPQQVGRRLLHMAKEIERQHLPPSQVSSLHISTALSLVLAFLAENFINL